MPTGKNYLYFALVNLGFIAQIALLMYYTSSANVKNNWNEYRCNPAYWIYSDDVSSDFTYCIQTVQTNFMGNLLQPLEFVTSSLSGMMSGFVTEMDSMRSMISKMRDFTGSSTTSIYGI